MSSEIVIQATNLSKKYVLGKSGPGSDGLRHAIHNLATAPLRRFSGRGAKVAPETSGAADSLGRGKDGPRLAGTEFYALKDVSFEVRRGEVIGIIGRNGAGKSTLLKILSRITEPTTGQVGIKGRVASLLEVGTGFHPELTGRENIFLNGAILGMSRQEIISKFDEIVAFAEVERFLNTPVKRYSSGMYVRLAFAVAAHLEPEILIVDEVLAVGDAAFQRKCLGKMNNVARDGRTVFFVSHSMASVKRLCSSVIRLSQGQLVDRGEPGSVIAGYLNEDLVTAPSVEIGEHQHLTKSPLRIEGVEILNSRFEPSDTILYGEDIYVRLRVHSSEAVSSARLGVGLNVEGVRVSTLTSPPVDFSASPRPRSFTCKIPGKTLLPNQFTLQLGAHSGETGRGLDWVMDAVSFKVLEVSGSDGDEFDRHQLGLVAMDSSWEEAAANRATVNVS
jgi:lipopolysaccharide transport system ATP-binding protein